MRNLPAPSRESDEADLRKGVRRYRYNGEWRGHDITDEEIEAVVAMYDKYEGDKGISCSDYKGHGWPASLIATIQAAYDKTQEGRHLQSLRDLVFKGVELCPVCGIDPPTELDHHLPQSVFKLLAIHTRNLIPMCHLCNHAKLAGFGEKETGFLHAYYDILPDVDFLVADIKINGDALLVSFKIDEEALLPPGFGDRLSEQMFTLGLANRYQQEVNTYVSSHAASLHLTFRTNGQAGVRKLLRLQTICEVKEFHRNHWRPALMRALQTHDGFTNGGFADVLPISEEMLQDLEEG